MSATDPPDISFDPVVEELPDELLPRVRQVVGVEFEVVGILGKGGMANVYLAFDRILGRMVALKVLHPLILQSAGMRERFIREARMGAALGHRNVVPTFSLRESGGLIVLILRAVMGRPLSAILAEEGPLPVPLTQRIIAQVAGALAYSHSKGVIHRDIKPGNILIDEDGGVAVSDFGIAKALEDPNLTSTGSRIGTPAYMSPEQCNGTLVTPAADQYALGVVAYEMLTGRMPFAADTAMGLMYAQTNHTPTPLRELRPDISAELAGAVDRMMAKEPEGRWPSLDEMVRQCGRPMVDGIDDPYADELGRLARRGSPALQLAATYHPSPTPSRRSDPDAATLVFVEPPRPRPLRRLPWLIGVGAVAAAALFAWPEPAGQEFPPLPRVRHASARDSTPRTVAPGSTSAAGAARRASGRIPDPRSDTLATRREIGRVLQRYSRAVESRKIADVIAAFPGLTPEDQRTWEQLFQEAPAIRFDISVGKTGYQQRGAESDLRGFIAYTPRGSNRRQVEAWNKHAEFAVGPEGWRIVRIR